MACFKLAVPTMHTADAQRATPGSVAMLVSSLLDRLVAALEILSCQRRVAAHTGMRGDTILAILTRGEHNAFTNLLIETPKQPL